MLIHVVVHVHVVKLLSLFFFFFFVSVALTVAVFLVEKSGRLLNLEEGRNTIAGTINTIMAENLSLPPVASQVFCVWLISPLLRK